MSIFEAASFWKFRHEPFAVDGVRLHYWREEAAPLYSHSRLTPFFETTDRLEG